MAFAQALLDFLIEEPLADAVANDAIEIRRDFGLKLPDAVIAATARINGWTLMTANAADFKKVSGLNQLLVSRE